MNVMRAAQVEQKLAQLTSGAAATQSAEVDNLKKALEKSQRELADKKRVIIEMEIKVCFLFACYVCMRWGRVALRCCLRLPRPAARWLARTQASPGLTAAVRVCGRRWGAARHRA